MIDNIANVQKQADEMKAEMVGSRYRHFKGGIYIVTDIAVHSENDEILVVYKTFDSPNLTWCRPLDMFLSEVDHEKYPGVKQKYRFERMCNDND